MQDGEQHFIDELRKQLPNAARPPKVFLITSLRKVPLAQLESTHGADEPTVVFGTSAVRSPRHETNVNKAAITAITTKPPSIIPPSMVSCRFKLFTFPPPPSPLPDNRTETQKFLCCGAPPVGRS